MSADATGPLVSPPESQSRSELVISTPEGVPLRFEIGSLGDRAAAFLIDGTMILIVPIALSLMLCLLQGPLLRAFITLLVFLLRNFYFAFFEVRWKGMTPGKRRMGLRVIDQLGGPLRAESVITRNLMRELEVFIPVVVLVSPDVVWPDQPGLLRAFASIWAGILLLLPLFNRHRLRLGDIVGGTVVVSAPRGALLPDQTRPGKGKESEVAPETVYRFTAAQLDVYGNYELQVLENVLRRRALPGGDEAIATVFEKVSQKIGWDGGEADPQRFLQDFYAAQRAHLEHRKLMGREKASKEQDE